MSEESSVGQISTENQLLRSLPAENFERLRPHLRTVELPGGKVLFDVEDEIDQMFFPETAIISVVTSTESGQTAESGVIGWEGMSGVEVLMEDPKAIHRYIVQLPGKGVRVPVGVIKDEFEACGDFQKSILAFTREMMVQMSQTVLCNRLHVAEQRLAKWLLMCRDRSQGDVLAITQEFAALMLGSNRVSVTQAAIQLQEHDLIEYARGRITIVDRDGLETFSCECYQRIRQEFDQLTC